jgi:hypothetical protein
MVAAISCYEKMAARPSFNVKHFDARGERKDSHFAVTSRFLARTASQA